MEATFFLLPFLASTIVGSIVAVLGLLTLRRAGVIRMAQAK
jgi:predicted membrane protein